MVRGQRPDLSTLCKLSQFLGEPIGLLLNAAGFVPAINGPQDPLVLTTTDDWATIKALCIMRGLPPDRRTRLLHVIKLFAEDGGRDTAIADAPGNRRLQVIMENGRSPSDKPREPKAATSIAPGRSLRLRLSGAAPQPTVSRHRRLTRRAPE